MSSISNDVLKPIEALSGDGKNRVRVEFLRMSLPSKLFFALLAVPMLIAFGISAYLTYVSVTASEIAGCTGGDLFDCSHVIHSKWSKFYGFPVSGLALGTYAAMIFATVVASISKLSSPTRLTAWSAVTGLAIAAAFAALYFIYLQVVVLEHLCPWCLGAHTCGLLIAVAVLANRNRIAMPPLATVTGFAAIGLAVMIGVQVNSEEPPKYEEIVYVPEEKAAVDAEDGSTFTAAPSDFDEMDEDGMLAPPADDDEDLFAPPVDDFEDDDSFMEPPSEDDFDDDSQASFRGFWQSNQLAAMGSLLLSRNSLHLISTLQDSTSQQQASETKQEADQDGQASEDSTKKKKAGKKARKKKSKVRIVEFMGKKLNAYQWPIDGSPDAKYVFVEMFDYTCQHCRTTSKAIFKAKEAMGDDLAVVVLAVPMNTACNPVVTRDHASHVEACQLSELAVAVWRIDAKKFSEFHKWMLTEKLAPTYATALGKAIEMVGKEEVEKELNKKTAKAFVKSHCQMYKMLKGGPVPKLLFPTRAIQGEFTGVEALKTMIKEQAGGGSTNEEAAGNSRL